MGIGHFFSRWRSAARVLLYRTAALRLGVRPLFGILSFSLPLMSLCPSAHAQGINAWYAAPGMTEVERLSQFDARRGNSGVTGPEETLKEMLEAGLVDPAEMASVEDDFGWEFGVSFRALYDSNIFLAEDDEVSDTQFTIAPQISYSTPDEARIGFSALYRPEFQFFVDRDDLDSVDHHVGVSAYGTGRLSWEVSPYYTRDSGADRFAGTYVEQDVYGATAQVVYGLSGKSDMEATALASKVDYRTGGFSNSWRAQGRLSWLYEATPKLSLGPSAGYLYQEADNVPSRESILLGMRLDYQATAKLNLASRVGVGIDNFGGVEGDARLDLDVLATWRINERWGLRLSGYYEPQPSPVGRDFYIDTLGVAGGVSYYRDESVFTVWVNYEDNNYRATSSSVAGGFSGSGHFTAVGADCSFQLFSDDLRWNLFSLYRINDARSGVPADWENFQGGLSVTYDF